jgi:hypothetical protein
MDLRCLLTNSPGSISRSPLYARSAREMSAKKDRTAVIETTRICLIVKNLLISSTTMDGTSGYGSLCKYAIEAVPTFDKKNECLFFKILKESGAVLQGKTFL